MKKPITRMSLFLIVRLEIKMIQLSIILNLYIMPKLDFNCLFLYKFRPKNLPAFRCYVISWLIEVNFDLHSFSYDTNEPLFNVSHTFFLTKCTHIVFKESLFISNSSSKMIITMKISFNRFLIQFLPHPFQVQVIFILEFSMNSDRVHLNFISFFSFFGMPY